MNSAWSARWSREEADEFLFLVGDLWLILDREELLGDNAQQNKVTTRHQLVIETSLNFDKNACSRFRRNNFLKAY